MKTEPSLYYKTRDELEAYRKKTCKRKAEMA